MDTPLLFVYDPALALKIATLYMGASVVLIAIFGAIAMIWRR